MELEKQVCSLELAKKLKELGVKQESLFWWNISDGIVIGEQYRRPPSISAFTVAELGEMLPGNFNTIRRGDGSWLAYDGNAADNVNHQEISDTEADARAKMLIYLLENNLLTPPDTK